MDSSGSEEAKTAGEYLRSKRKDAGMTVDEISSITKIRTGYIESIENGDFSQFTSQHLLKGYIKLIAKTVRADEKKAVGLLEPELKENFKDRHVEDIVGNRFKEEKEKSDKFRKRVAVIVLIGFLAIALSYAAVKLYNLVGSAHISKLFKFSGRKASPVLSPKISGLEKGGKVSAAGSRQPAVLPQYAVVLSGAVTEKTWVAVEIDGGDVQTSMLYPGYDETWKAKNILKIKIGNAAGIDLTYNGKDLGKPGGEKQVITLNFPPLQPANPTAAATAAFPATPSASPAETGNTP